MAGRPIGITMGDPAGIGPEIVARLLAEPLPAPCVIYGDAGRLRMAARLVGAEAALGGVDLVQVGALPEDLPFGVVDARAGAASHAYVARAIDEALAGRIAAIVTAPISKAAWHAAGIDWPGHTELLAARAGVAEVSMMMANDELRVVLVSIHVALAEAVRAVTPGNELRAIRHAHAAMRRFGVAQPRIAVAGLNPHAGEGGKFGGEEVAVIAPAIAAARAEGIDASGPWPGDTVFARARAGAFDAVVAQYHDQGLIPVKYLGIDAGVNITLGLPFVRTSPDHGTAFDIAGTGQARAESLRAALRMAMRLAFNR
jgi:4-hydroxythreonine-4-phosphate dehydrogenase